VTDSGHGGDRVTALLASPGKTSPASDPADEALALLCLRRLANRHGCREDGCDAAPAVHNADVACLREWLEMLAFIPYQSGERGYQPERSPVAAASYRRPGT